MAAEAAMNAAEGGDVRADLVARVRSEIASGTYETPDKVAIAIENLLDEMG
jgi:negative regulator of flagellin synthesis FlgM